jgi:hypothetical protein
MPHVPNYKFSPGSQWLPSWLQYANTTIDDLGDYVALLFKATPSQRTSSKHFEDQGEAEVLPPLPPEQGSTTRSGRFSVPPQRFKEQVCAVFDESDEVHVMHRWPLVFTINWWHYATINSVYIVTSTLKAGQSSLESFSEADIKPKLLNFHHTFGSVCVVCNGLQGSGATVYLGNLQRHARSGHTPMGNDVPGNCARKEATSPLTSCLLSTKNRETAAKKDSTILLNQKSVHRKPSLGQGELPLNHSWSKYMQHLMTRTPSKTTSSKRMLTIQLRSQPVGLIPNPGTTFEPCKHATSLTSRMQRLRSTWESRSLELQRALSSV